MVAQKPTDEKTLFLVSDDARQETGNKFSLLGLLLGDIYVGIKGGGPATLNSLALMFVFRDGEGSFKGRVGILDPSGKQVGGADKMDFEKKAGQPMVSVIKLQTMPIVDGQYSIFVEIDGTRYVRTFRIRVVDITNGLPPEAR